MTIVAHGIGGIGRVLAGIGGESEGGVNQEILSNTVLSELGYLLEGLSGLVLSLEHSRSDIKYMQAQHAALTGEYD